MLELVKEYLHIDYDDEDNVLNLLIETAKTYIADTIGKFDENNSKQKLILLSIVSSIYNNKDYACKNSAENVQYTFKSLILQEQLKQLKEE